MNYVLVRRYNNNVVEAVDHHGRHVVLSGKGVGFGLAKGDTVDGSKVSVRYIPESEQDAARISSALAEIPLPVSLIARQAAIIGREMYDLAGGVAFELALADHIVGAIRRVEQGQHVELPLFYELAQLYPSEVEFGNTIVSAVHARLGVQLPEDEAGAIALHAVADQFGGSTVSGERSERIGTALAMTSVIEGALEIIRRESGRPVPATDAATARFVTHMRFLFRRLESRREVEPGPAAVIAAVRDSLASSWGIGEKIAELIRRDTGFDVGESETAYITLHVGRLVDVR